MNFAPEPDLWSQQTGAHFPPGLDEPEKIE